MQPLDPDKKPAVHTTPLNHVGLWIDDLPDGGGVADGAGRALCAGRHPQGRGGFRHLLSCTPRATTSSRLAGEGVLIELVQAPPEVVSAFERLAHSR